MCNVMILIMVGVGIRGTCIYYICNVLARAKFWSMHQLINVGLQHCIFVVF